jgi:hypothetical protein
MVILYSFQRSWDGLNRYIVSEWQEWKYLIWWTRREAVRQQGRMLVPEYIAEL